MSTIIVASKDGCMTVSLVSEIDHHSAKKLRDEIDAAIDRVRPDKLILDFTNVNFMDSSGVGLIIGRYKLLQEYGGTISLKNLNKQCRRLLEISGISKIIEF